VAGTKLAGSGRTDGPLADVTDAVGWKTAPTDAGSPDASDVFARPTFDYVQDLRTGSILEVKALVEASMQPPAAADEPGDQESGFIYLRDWKPESGVPGAPKGDGDAAPAPVTEALAASAQADEPESGAAKLPDQADLDNWPPAGWSGFNKTDFDAPPPAADAASGKPAGAVTDPVHYATKLIGTDGDDVINGTTGNDFFNGLGGDDVLNGGPGADSFMFMPGFGQDVVIGFTAGAAGDDIIEFRGVFEDFAGVLAASRQVGTNVVIELDDDNGVALIDVALSSLNQDDFRFV
jgi:hypothetical protein